MQVIYKFLKIQCIWFLFRLLHIRHVVKFELWANNLDWSNSSLVTVLLHLDSKSLRHLSFIIKYCKMNYKRVPNINTPSIVWVALKTIAKGEKHPQLYEAQKQYSYLVTSSVRVNWVAFRVSPVLSYLVWNTFSEIWFSSIKLGMLMLFRSGIIQWKIRKTQTLDSWHAVTGLFAVSSVSIYLPKRSLVENRCRDFTRYIRFRVLMNFGSGSSLEKSWNFFYLFNYFNSKSEGGCNETN